MNLAKYLKRSENLMLSERRIVMESLRESERRRLEREKREEADDGGNGSSGSGEGAVV